MSGQIPFPRFKLVGASYFVASRGDYVRCLVDAAARRVAQRRAAESYVAAREGAATDQKFC